MKKFIIKNTAALAAAFITLLCLSFTASAASASVGLSAKSVTVGTRVTATVTLSADSDIYAFQCNISFNGAVLGYVSGADTANDSTLSIVRDVSGGSRQSVSVVFTAKAAGSSNISATVKYSGMDLIERTVSASASVSVANKPVAASSKPAAPSVSDNALLSSLSVEGGTLSPAFSPSVTEYSVTLPNMYSAANITASAADRNAKISGTGKQTLQDGDNSFTVSVTATDGKTKKSYKINVRRLTVDETIASDPLAVRVDGELREIEKDISALSVPEGFSPDVTTFNGQEIGVFSANGGDITLFRLKDAAGGADYYIYVSRRDEFERLKYLVSGDKFYVFLDLPEDKPLPDGYAETTVEIAEREVPAYRGEDPDLTDFFVVYCYEGGITRFYSYDLSEKTLQRAPWFMQSAEPAAAQPDEASDIAVRRLFAALCACGVVIIALGISLIAAVRRRKSRRVADALDDGELDELLALGTGISSDAPSETPPPQEPKDELPAEPKDESAGEE